MIPATQAEILSKLAQLCELSDDIRFGQLLAFLGFLAEDMFGRGLWDVEDEELIRAIDRHAEDLSQRHARIAQ